MHVDRGLHANRTVVTFVGNKQSVFNGAWSGIKKSAEVIDMRSHKGVHPRIGATDVCPFIPIKNVNMAECITISKKLGKKAAEELDIPVYLYEEAAADKTRKNLAAIRQGEYEGLEKRMESSDWSPDFGDTFNARFGALVTGARNFLIAYNVNLNTKNVELAQEIAGIIRTSGQKIQKNGIEKKEPGCFEAVKAIGWYIQEYGCAQVSMNLTNYHKTMPHQVYDKISELARQMGLQVTGSEVIGLILKEPLLEAAEHFLAKQGQEKQLSERELIDIAIRYLGLNDVAEFRPDEKIFEFKLERCDL